MTEKHTQAQSEPEVRAALSALWERTRSVLLGRVDELENAVVALLEGRLDPAGQREAERAAHKVAGSAGTFGYHRATDLARELERLFAGEKLNAHSDGPQAADRVEALRRELDAPADGSTPALRERAKLLIAHPDAERAERLATAAQQHGLSALLATSVGDALGAIASQRVGAALVDLDLPGGETLALIAELSRLNPDVATLVTSSGAAFVDRVETSRAGARGFLSAAQSENALIEAVTEMIGHGQQGQERLLAVDDDPVVLELLKDLFAGAGLPLTTVADPSQFWDVLVQTAPDLLLLDVDMPNVTGLELCRLLRADPRWATLPVLVLTGSVGADLVHEVFAAGADDYVSKPVVGAELLTRVTNRLERVRLYRKLADTDVLTGLANRRKFSAEFDRLQLVANRHGQPLSLALLDLDNFKRVNDRYGHAVGDAVLRRLGELLSRHFRAEDIVARWGGEEVALGLYGMTRADGVTRVASALEAMREEIFNVPGQPAFQVTFSAGVAELGADGDDLHSLCQAADEVLYLAKAMGRDRVLPVGWRPEDSRAVDVVVVEDDETLSELLAHSLTTRGLRCLQLRDGPSAVSMLCTPGAPPPSVILLDVDLPGLNGLDVLGELRRADVLARSKVIMLTGRAGETEVLAAFEGGAFDHVAKPFSVPVLMQRIRRALAGDE